MMKITHNLGTCVLINSYLLRLEAHFYVRKFDIYGVFNQNGHIFC